MLKFYTENRIWLIPIFLFAAIAPFTPFLDRKIESYFYLQGTPGDPFSHSAILKFIYNWGTLPGQVVAAAALLVFILSFFVASLKRLKPHALFVALTLAIGSGLITHAILKDFWGRPRPKQVIEFGGKQPFRPFFYPNLFHSPEPSKSFPCGHCTLGFYFFFCIILGKRLKKRGLFYLGIFLSAVLGGALSYARMAQGGHFLSDVLFSALVMWLTAVFLDRLIYKEKL